MLLKPQRPVRNDFTVNTNIHRNRTFNKTMKAIQEHSPSEHAFVVDKNTDFTPSPKYNELAIDEKVIFMKKVCNNCLQNAHRFHNSSSACNDKECKRSHYTSMHRQKAFKANSATVEVQKTDETIVTSQGARGSK